MPWSLYILWIKELLKNKVFTAKYITKVDSSSDSSKYLSIGGRCYEYDVKLTREEVEQVFQVLNDVYGDTFFIEPTPIGYAYYL